MPFHTLCHVDDIEEGKGQRFVVDNLAVAVFLVDGEYRALQDSCPHAGASLACGYVDGNLIRCRIHHWGFSLESGRCKENDSDPYRARTFATRIVDGNLQVDVETS